MKKTREVIFSAHVEYKWDLLKKGHSFRPNSKDSNINVEALERDIKEIIVEKLPNEMKNIFSIDIRTRIITTRYGSLSIFFGAVVAGVGIIAGYKDFYDSIHLLQDQCHSLIQALLMRHPDTFDLKISIEHPRLPEPNSGRLFSRLRKSFDLMPEELEELFDYTAMQNTGKRRRDGFFWYLLFMNIVLLAVVAVLVGPAVLKVYFP